MKPPFFGTRIADKITLEGIADLVDRDVLFTSRWQFKQNVSKEDVTLIFERLIGVCESKGVIEPKLVYGYFECKKQETALLITPNPPSFSGKFVRFEFPRQRSSPNLCVADFFQDGFIAMQLVTIGDKVIQEGARLFNEKKYAEAFYLKGLAAELTEGLAKYGHSMICKELGIPETQGCRFSFGYPALPNLADQKKLYDILDAGRIGVSITKTYHLDPEYSTSAIISVAKEAKLFRP